MSEDNLNEAIEAFRTQKSYSIGQKSWASATTRFEMAEDFAMVSPNRVGGEWYSVVLVITSRTARSVEAVSQAEHEKEYIVGKNAVFKIRDIVPIDGYYKFITIFLDEVLCE